MPDIQKGVEARWFYLGLLPIQAVDVESRPGPAGDEGAPFLEDQIFVIGYVMIHGVRYVDLAGVTQSYNFGGQIDDIAENIILFHKSFVKMNSDPHLNLFSGSASVIMATKIVLNAHRGLDRLIGIVKIGHDRIAQGFYHPAVASAHRP